MRQLSFKFFSFSLIAATSHVFTPLGELGVSVPRSAETLALLRNIPLTRIGVKSLSNVRLDGDHYFDFEQRNDALVVDKTTGSVLIGNKFKELDETTTFILNIREADSKEVEARISITATPIDVDSVEEFCNRFTSKLCFWDNALFRITEHNLFLQEVGKLAPSAYSTLCPNAIVEYKVLDGKWLLLSFVL